MISSFWAVFSGDFGGADDFRGELVGAGETGGILQERVKKDRKVEIARGFCVFRADFLAVLGNFGDFWAVLGDFEGEDALVDWVESGVESGGWILGRNYLFWIIHQHG